MVNEYFDYIIKHLTIEEMQILAYLKDTDATIAFKSIKRTEILQATELSIAHFRKAIGKLVSTCLIDVVTGSKEQKVFLTEYGLKAIKPIEEGEKCLDS